MRKTIEALEAPLPEELPPAPSIRRMVEQRRRAVRNRVIKPVKKDQPEHTQDELF